MEMTDNEFLEIAATYRFQTHPQYGEWLVLKNDGPRPCRFENWHHDDLTGFVGGEYAKPSIEGK